MSSRQIQSQIKVSNFVIKGMTCASCSNGIEKHLKTCDGIKLISVNVLTNKARVEYDITVIRPRKIIQEIEDTGFDAELQPEDDQSDIREIVKMEMLKYRKKFFIGLSIYIPIAILIWVVPYVGLRGAMVAPNIWRGNTLYVFVIFVLSSIMQFYLGRHFYTSAYKSIKHKSANMDVLVVTSTTAAWVYGLALMFGGYTNSEQESDMYWHLIHSHVHNFETNAVLIFIVLLGKFIESFSKMKTVDKLSQLASLKVTKANLLKEQDLSKLNLSCKFDETPVELLEIDDFVLVQPGGAIPIDGVVVYGRGNCNESMLTGESRPVTKDIGVKVFGGTILL
jgi:Cu+-exporting ATPase